MKHISFDMILIAFLLFICVLLEHAFQLYGLFLIASIILFQRSKMMTFFMLTLMLGVISDILFASPLGMTTLVVNVSLFLWIALVGLSRLRFFFFILLVVSSTVVLSLFRSVHIHAVVMLLLIGISWFFARQLYLPKNTTGKISI